MNIYIFVIRTTYGKRDTLMPITAKTYDAAVTMLNRDPTIKNSSLNQILINNSEVVTRPDNPRAYDKE